MHLQERGFDDIRQCRHRLITVNLNFIMWRVIIVVT